MASLGHTNMSLLRHAIVTGAGSGIGRARKTSKGGGEPGQLQGKGRLDQLAGLNQVDQRSLG